MAILLNDNLKIAVAKPVDNRYGPYIDTATALSQIAVFQRYPGLTVGIRDSGDVVEYWFKDGVTELVPKTSAASAGDWQVISTSSSVADNSYVIADSSSAGFTLTLPASPASGSYVWIQDAKGSWETNNVIVDPNGNQIVGLSDSLSLNVSNSIVLLTYVGGDVGWDVKNVAGDFSDEFTILTPLTTAAISVGSSAQCASLTIDQYGRVVSASNNSITPQGIGAFSTADIISITNGGTGSTTAAAALTALRAQPALTSASPLGISQGGTGVVTNIDARWALGTPQIATIRHGSALVLQVAGALTGASWTGGSAVITFTSSSVTLVPGMSLSTGVTTGVIRTVDSPTQITMTANAGTTASGTINVFNSTISTLVSSSIIPMDGRTMVVGDIVILTAQPANAQNGPWVLTSLAGSVMSFVRPSYWTGTLLGNYIFYIQQGTANFGQMVSAAGAISTGSFVGLDAFSVYTATQRASNAVLGSNNFSGRQSFFGNTAQVNPCSFQTATALLSTRQAHAIEWDNNLMYITPQALATTQLNRSVNAAYIPALTSADILTLGSPMATLQIGALTSASAGVLGQTVLDTVNEVLYICIGSNKWRKVQLSNF